MFPDAERLSLSLSTFALAPSVYLFTIGFRRGLRHNKPYARRTYMAYFPALFLSDVAARKPRSPLIRACHTDSHQVRLPERPPPGRYKGNGSFVPGAFSKNFESRAYLSR